MNKAWKKMTSLHNSGARHIRKRRKLCNFTPTQILAHAGEEMIELASAQDDKEELADILTHLFHYAARKGWKRKDIEDIMIKKMENRINNPKGKRK